MLTSAARGLQVEVVVERRVVEVVVGEEDRLRAVHRDRRRPRCARRGVRLPVDHLLGQRGPPWHRGC